MQDSVRGHMMYISLYRKQKHLLARSHAPRSACRCVCSEDVCMCCTQSLSSRIGKLVLGMDFPLSVVLLH